MPQSPWKGPSVGRALNWGTPTPTSGPACEAGAHRWGETQLSVGTARTPGPGTGSQVWAEKAHRDT